MSEKYYCPECLSKLEKKEGCGSISYFCYTCRKLVSRSKMLTEEQMAMKERECAESPETIESEGSADA